MMIGEKLAFAWEKFPFICLSNKNRCNGEMLFQTVD